MILGKPNGEYSIYFFVKSTAGVHNMDPGSQLEKVLQLFANNRTSPPELFNALLSSLVVVVSANTRGDFPSLAKVTNQAGQPMLPIFSAAVRCGSFVAQSHPNRIAGPFKLLLNHLPLGMGIVINLNDQAIEIGPAGIEEMKRALANPRQQIDVPAGLAQLFAEDD